jgi:AraC-like DNA-binding protein
MLTGELKVRNAAGKVYIILSGQYLVADNIILQGEFKPGKECSFFCVYYSSAFLQTIGVKANFIQERPVFLPGAMKDLVEEILVNPYDQNLRAFYYDNAIGKLLLLHLAIPAQLPPGDLSNIEIAAVHYADRIIAENLHTHFTIRALAKKAGTNAYVLKKGFQQLFGIPVFQRLIQRRMERAKELLEKTNKPIKDICELAGYQTLGGFITSFRKRFDVTPKDWRKQKRGTI